jgi:hypothetical protein
MIATAIADAADTADVHPNLWAGNLRDHLGTAAKAARRDSLLRRHMNTGLQNSPCYHQRAALRSGPRAGI